MILTLFAFSFTAIFYVACSKDKTLAKEENVIKPNPISEEESLLAQAKQFGQTAYTHLRFNYLSHKPEEYVNPAIREKVITDYNKSAEEMKNLSTEERIAKNLADKKLTEKQATYFRSLLETTKELDGFSNFQQVEGLLDGFNKTLLTDKSMPNSEKAIILNTSFTIRRVIDYFVNIAYQPTAQNNTSISMRDFCVGGKKWSCIGSVLIGGLQIVSGVSSGNYFTAAIGLVGSITAISNLFSNSSCDCSSTGATCYSLYGVSLFRASNMDCNGNFVRFCAYGDGPFPSSYDWNLVELDQFDQPIPSTSYYLPSTSDNCANFSPDVNLNKKFRLTVRTWGTPNCNNGATVTKFFDFTWADVVGSAGTVLIDGPTDVYVGNTSTYFANGTFLTNPKNTFTWNFNLYQGSFTFGNITSGGGNNTSVNIYWTGASCGPGAFGNPNSYGCYTLGIGGYSANSCSGSQGWGSTSVAVRNY